MGAEISPLEAAASREKLLASRRMWRARTIRAETAISSVRALHAEPHECPEWDDAHGWVTGWFSGGGCPTIAALDSTDPVEAAPEEENGPALEGAEPSSNRVLIGVRSSAYAEPEPGSYWERGVLARFAAGQSTDLKTVREQLGALLRTIPAEASDGTHPDVPAPGRSEEKPPKKDRPAVRVEPSMRFGEPHIKGISTEAITGMLMAGESPETVCDDYSITRHELLVACWYEGTHGQYRTEWGRWAADVAYPQLAGWQPLDVDTMPMPPDRSDSGLPVDGEERK